ncbi:MAG: hypothetical protein QM770_14510 [Tepidisphaeraceae bacterium]
MSNANKFDLGRTVITANAQATLDVQDVAACLSRHAHGDWGDLEQEDRDENERSLRENCRLLSVYHDSAGTKFYIITEWDRSVTTVLLPEDY